MSKISPYLLCSNLILLAIIGLSACQANTKPSLPFEVLSLPKNKYETILRFSDGAILIQAEQDQYYWLNEDRFIDIPFPPPDPCRQVYYRFPTSLPDHQIGFAKSCHGYWPDRSLPQDEAVFLVAFDWKSNIWHQVVDVPLSNESGEFTWNPELTRGVQSVGYLLSTLQWISPSGATPMPLTIKTDKVNWYLPENFVAMENLDKQDVGIAWSPAWSPDGKTIAFWASTDVIGRDGMSRAKGSYALYLLDPTDLSYETILAGVRNMTPRYSFAWSPDSQWLLFDGKIWGRQGIWLISAEGEGLSSVVREGDRNALGWEWLNGHEVLVSQCVDKDCAKTTVTKYDLSSLMDFKDGE